AFVAASVLIYCAELPITGEPKSRKSETTAQNAAGRHTPSRPQLFRSECVSRLARDCAPAPITRGLQQAYGRKANEVYSYGVCCRDHGHLGYTAGVRADNITWSHGGGQCEWRFLSKRYLCTIRWFIREKRRGVFAQTL